MEKCILKKLNTEQQKLVENNHNLIYSFMNKHHLTENDIEDWYGTCAIALCNAAIAYDAKLNINFSTLAYASMNNALCKEIKRNKSVTGCISLDCDVTEDIKLLDCIRSNGDESGELEFLNVFYKNYLLLNDFRKSIIDEYINTEYTFNEIGKKYGISRQRANYIYRTFIRKIYSDLYESEGR